MTLPHCLTTPSFDAMGRDARDALARRLDGDDDDARDDGDEDETMRKTARMMTDDDDD